MTNDEFYAVKQQIERLEAKKAILKDECEKAIKPLDDEIKRLKLTIPPPSSDAFWKSH